MKSLPPDTASYDALWEALEDIEGLPPDAIRDTKALMTVLGGNIVYRNGL